MGARSPVPRAPTVTQGCRSAACAPGQNAAREGPECGLELAPHHPQAVGISQGVRPGRLLPEQRLVVHLLALRGLFLLQEVRKRSG